MKFIHLLILLMVPFLASCLPTDGILTREGVGELSLPYFEEAECPFAVEEDEPIHCGYLLVLENRDAPNGAIVELAVAILESRGENPASEPLLYLSGGPGGGTLVGIDDWLESPLRDDRAIILLDQRGTGYSIPNLACYEENEADVDERLDAVQDCQDRLVDLGVDLSMYNSAASAKDVRDLRLLLGYDEWNLLGISYGTRLALTIMRDHPQGIRSVILDSVYPPNVDAYTEEPRTSAEAIQALVEGCAADEACNAAYPELPRRLYQVLAALDNEPLLIDGEEYIGSDLINFLVESLYDTATIPTLPAIIYAAANGDYEPWLALLDEGATEYAGHKTSRQVEAEDEAALDDAQGVFYSVECREELPFGNFDAATDQVADFPAELAEPLLDSLAELYDICEFWGAGTAASVESEPVTSEIPTLLLVGEYDPVTPPAWAQLAAQTLPNSTYVEWPRGGHSIIDAGSCATEIANRFLADPKTVVDISCVAEAQLPFELP